MKNRELREYYSEINEDAVFFDNPCFDNSIIGISNGDRIVYDYEKMISELMEDDGITEEDARDMIEHETLRSVSFTGPNGPIVVFPKPDISERQ